MSVSSLENIHNDNRVPVALENINQALQEAGGADLAEGLERIKPFVLDALGKTWPEVLACFAEEEAEDADVL